MEGSLVLSVSALMRAGALVPGERTGGAWGWRYEGEDRPHAIVGYEADFTEPDDLRVCHSDRRPPRAVPQRHCVRPARRSRTLQDGRGSH